jgi:hypothetical protein
LKLSLQDGNIKDPNFNWEVCVSGVKLTDMPKDLLSSQYATLKELYLCHAGLTSVPSGISSLGALRKLQLSNNKIT